MKMKTGCDLKENFFPETFSIVLLGLEGILKRASFKDSVLFKEHNPEYIFNSDLFCSGVCFNLFSEYGVGKKIEPLLEDLFINIEINSENYLKNVFYQEIIKLSPIILTLIREN